MKYKRIIFVAQSGTSREPMAAGIMKDLIVDSEVEILARGLVVQFPEPLNQKAEAVMISNGTETEGFTSAQLDESEVTSDTVIFTMETVHRERVLENYTTVLPEQIFVLSEFVGDELEILDPYGGQLPNYGLCYESLRMTIKKLIKILYEVEE